MAVFRCGHQATAENTKTDGKCRTCRQAYERDRKRKVFGHEPRTRPIQSSDTRVSRRDLGPAIYGCEADHVSVAEGSRALLRALWRHHAPILHHAEQAGRQVVKL